MMTHIVVVYLHFLGIMALMATLLAEHVTLQPNMTRLHVQRLATIDLCYGIAAGIVLITGILRFAYVGKGIPFYLGNPIFYVKVGLFLLIGIISIYPTIIFLSWRKMIKQDQELEVATRQVKRLRHLVRLELGLLLVIPLLAVLMARGIGITAS